MSNYSLVRGRALRATRLNGCGATVPGADSVVVTEGFISVGLTSNVEAGEPISVTNAAGNVCILDSPAPKFVNYSVEIAFCGVNPELVTLMTGQKVTLGPTGSVTGFRINSKLDVSTTGFALEMWSNVSVSACAGGVDSYGYMLLPFVKGGTLGDFTVENGAINFTLTGAQTKEGSGWGVGPFNVVRTAGGSAGPLLLPVTAGDHLVVEVTTVPPPSTSSDTAQALGVLATTITAGIPATLTPANSYPPKDLAAANAATTITKSPATVWTTGQYVVLGDGSFAYWTGTAWAAGAKP